MARNRNTEYTNHNHNEEYHLGKTAGTIFGVILIVLGIIAVGAMGVTTYATLLFAGWILLIGGIVRVVQAFWGKGWSGFFLDLFTGILLGMGGVLLLNNPTVGIGAVSFLLSLVFMVSGVTAVVSSLAVRYPNWGWSLAYGVLAFAFGLAVWRHWPFSGIYLIGFFIGLELIVSGIALIAGSYSPQHASKPTTTAVAV